MNNLLRIDDIGASTKQFNQYGQKKARLLGLPCYFPLANLGFFKRIEPWRGWGPYEELTATEWQTYLDFFQSQNIKPIVAITASWVEAGGTLTPFPQKFPEEASLLKQAAEAGLITIANHGLSHSVIGYHLPKFWQGNRQFHREFWPYLPQSTHDEHLSKSQEILENFFQRPVSIFVPPGNIWSHKTYQALRQTNIRQVMANRYMSDSQEAMEGIEFVADQDYLVIHDRDLKLKDLNYLKNLL
jgi:hypothetical protein